MLVSTSNLAIAAVGNVPVSVIAGTAQSSSGPGSKGPDYRIRIVNHDDPLLVDANGIVYGRDICERGFPPIYEVRLCKRWLAHAPRTRNPVRKRAGFSYALKHVVERLARTYISNGSLILAAYELGIPQWAELRPGALNSCLAVFSIWTKSQYEISQHRAMHEFQGTATQRVEKFAGMTFQEVTAAFPEPVDVW